MTPMSSIEDYMNKEIAKKEKELLNVFCYVGETCIKEARESGAYQDQTGNLRSSIGYVVLRDGVAYQSSNFDQVKGGSDGAKEGEAFLNSIIQGYRQGLVLIVVAGMNYAAYVDALGLNVLTSAELIAEQLVPQMLKKLGFTKS